MEIKFKTTAQVRRQLEVTLHTRSIKETVMVKYLSPKWYKRRTDIKDVLEVWKFHATETNLLHEIVVAEYPELIGKVFKTSPEFIILIK